MDTQLKQRLIGGAVLVALAVIFLPMLVQGPAPDSGVADVSTRVPDAPGGEYETRELPLGPDAAGVSGPSVLPAPAAAEPAQPAAPAPEATAAAARPDPAVAAGQWAVTFGAYAGERDAQAVLSRLRWGGCPASASRTPSMVARYHGASASAPMQIGRWPRRAGCRPCGSATTSTRR